MIGAGVLNPSQLPDGFPSKAVMVDFATRYTAKYNEGTSLFAGLGYDSAHILFAGLTAGVDDKAKIRDGIEAIQNLPISQGVVNFSPTDHQLHGGYNEWLVKSGQFTFDKALELTQSLFLKRVPGSARHPRPPFEKKGVPWPIQICRSTYATHG